MILGLVFGTWTCHQYVGNVIAALVASAILMVSKLVVYFHSFTGDTHAPSTTVSSCCILIVSSVRHAFLFLSQDNLSFLCLDGLH